MSVMSRAMVVQCGLGLLDQRDASPPGRAAAPRRCAPGAGRRRPSWTVVCAAAGVDGAEQPARARLDDLDGRAARAADVGQVGGALPPRPVPAGGRGGAAARARRAGGSSSAAAGPKSAEVGLGERDLGGGGAQVRGQDVGVVRVEDGRLDRRAGRAPRGGGRDRCPAGRPGRPGRPARPARRGPARPACCHSGGAGAGIAGDEHGVQPGDVDAELQRVGGGQPEQLAGVQGRAPGRAAPRADSRRGRRRRAQVSVAVDGAPSRSWAMREIELGAAPGADEGDRAHALHREVGEQFGGLGGRRTAHGAPRSPSSSVSGGSHRAKTSSPRGEASSVTAVTGTPVSRRGRLAGVGRRWRRPGGRPGRRRSGRTPGAAGAAPGRRGSRTRRGRCGTRR